MNAAMLASSLISVSKSSITSNSFCSTSPGVPSKDPCSPIAPLPTAHHASTNVTTEASEKKYHTTRMSPPCRSRSLATKNAPATMQIRSAIDKEAVIFNVSRFEKVIRKA